MSTLWDAYDNLAHTRVINRADGSIRKFDATTQVDLIDQTYVIYAYRGGETDQPLLITTFPASDWRVQVEVHEDD